MGSVSEFSFHHENPIADKHLDDHRWAIRSNARSRMSRNETGCCYHRNIRSPAMRAHAMGLGFSAGKASDLTSRDKRPSGSGASVGAAIEIIYPQI